MLECYLWILRRFYAFFRREDPIEKSILEQLHTSASRVGGVKNNIRVLRIEVGDHGIKVGILDITLVNYNTRVGTLETHMLQLETEVEG